MTGLERIQSVFAKAKAEGRAVFMPYHAMGYPDRARTLQQLLRHVALARPRQAVGDQQPRAVGSLPCRRRPVVLTLTRARSDGDVLRWLRRWAEVVSLD